MDKRSQDGASFGNELVVEKYSYFIDFIPWYKYALKNQKQNLPILFYLELLICCKWNDF